MKFFVAIAIGGAVGAVGRYYIAGQIIRLVGSGFPWHTLFVNVVGSFAMGLLFEFFSHRWNIGAELRAFLTVGILGSFTTFSAFSLDVLLLLEREALYPVLGYVLASVSLSILGILSGVWLVRTFIL